MKSKILFTCLVIFTFVTFSCKKESAPAIVGEWRMSAVYTNTTSGSYEWITTIRFPELLTFNSDSKFSSFTDVPGGSGTYSYSRVSNELQLNFEADNWYPTRSTVLKVESLTKDKLVTLLTYASGIVRKNEYTRVN